MAEALGVRGFSRADIAAMRCRPWQEPMRAAMLAQIDALAASAGAGEAWTALDDGVPVLCIGYAIVWSGRATGWAVCGDMPARLLRPAVREIRRMIPLIMHRHRLHRLDSPVATGNSAALRFAEALGLRPGALLDRYAPDGSACLLYEVLQ